MKNLIKELKRDIITGFEYADEEMETYPQGNYRVENLILERGKVLYSCREYSPQGNEKIAATILCTAEEFLKTPIKELENSINAAYYYNLQEVEG